MIDTKTKLEREQVWSNGFITLEKVNFEREGFEPYSHVRVVKRDAVAGILYNTATDKYIFVKQYRTGPDSVLTEAIAGTMDVPGEAAVDCFAREIAEEAGYEMTYAELICVSHTTPGVCNEKIHVFYAETDGKKTGTGGGVGHEQIEIVELSFNEVVENVELRNDMKTFIAILYLINKKNKK
jgi:ADP-ribose pyrophosphatase